MTFSFVRNQIVHKTVSTIARKLKIAMTNVKNRFTCLHSWAKSSFCSSDYFMLLYTVTVHIKSAIVIPKNAKFMNSLAYEKLSSDFKTKPILQRIIMTTSTRMKITRAI